LGASLRLAPACRKRLSDLQPDQGIADSPQSFRKQLYCFCIKNYWGSLSPVGEGWGEGTRTHPFLVG
ncbi:hypothetical protein ABK668_06120, partial [Enterobacter hormaechei]